MINILGIAIRLLYTTVALPLIRGAVVNGITIYVVSKFKKKNEENIHKDDAR